ncbi:hypothetical protein [Clavibacter zhangzhiyongii]|uniref:hypothetical protein n=1 Tax=Clavibacter zhangzhiyongii TaxID=2768071 RepID=UPI0039DF5E89
MPMAVLVDPPDAWSMNQLSGERSKASSRDGDTGTRASGSVRSTTGSVVEGARRPYHSAGSAPVTPSAARRARAEAAARPRSRVASAGRRAVRSPEVTRSVVEEDGVAVHDRELAPERADEAAERERVVGPDPRSAAGASFATRPASAPASASARPGAGGTSRRNGDGASSSLAVALRTTTRDARETASASIRSSSPRAPRPARRRRPGRGPRATAERRWGCSRDPRSRRLGQTPSCSAATATDLVPGAHDRGRRGDEHGVGERLRRERVLGHLGAEQLLDEVGRGPAGVPLDEAARGREERDDAVEVAVRLVGDDAGLQRLLEPLRREAGSLPQMPEQLLDGAVRGRELPPALQRAREAAEAPGGREVERLEPAGRRERLDEQLVARPVAVARELLLAEREAEAAERDPVEPAERTRGELRPRAPA